MDQAEFERVAASFAAFHAEFAPLFGRKEVQRRSEPDVRGLLVQQTDRRHADNVAEMIDGATPRTLQRLLREVPWATEPVIDRLQASVGARLNTPEGIVVLAESDFPKQGTKSVGVARPYRGTLGQAGHCQRGVFLSSVSARGHALVDKRLSLPSAWTDDPARCRAAGVPESISDQSKADLGLDMVRQARAAGPLHGGWVTGDDAYGMVPALRDALGADDWRSVRDVPATTPVFTQPAPPLVPSWSGRGRVPTTTRLAPAAPPPQPVPAVAARLALAAWRDLTVAAGSHGRPGRACGLLLRRNLDGSEPRNDLSTAAEDTPLLTLAQVAAARWTIETAVETAKGDTGLDEYEVRSWAGWPHHLTLALLAAAVLLILQQD